MKTITDKLKGIKKQLTKELSKENIGIISERSIQILDYFDNVIKEVVQRERLNEETICKCKIPTTDWNPFDMEDKSENHTHCTVCKGKLPSRCDSYV